MNKPAKTLLVCLSIICAVPATPRAVFAEQVTSGRVGQVSAESHRYPEILSTNTDPMGAWIEQHGERFGLFDPPSKKRPSVKARNSNESKSLVYRPNVDRGSTHSVLFGYLEDESGKYSVPDINTFPVKKFTPPPEALKSDDAAVQISAVMKDLKYANTCSKFATRDGFGVWGNFIIDQLLRGKNDKLLKGTNDLRAACPAYDYLGAREKSYVWVKIFAAMAHRESSCDPSASIPGPNGQAAGLLQLHEGSESKYAKGCQRNDSGSAGPSLRCGMSIVEAQIQRTSLLFSPDTYFGVLRPQGDLIQTKNGLRRVVISRLVIGGLKELPFCQRI